MEVTGQLNKMKTALDKEILYSMRLGDELVELNPWIGKEISLQFTGKILCVNCGKETKKSFGQGFCYPCFINSPENSDCIIKPELCRGHLGEGRDVEWEKSHHVQPHYVYLALSSDVKVGVTRNTQVPTRWIDQGATQAVILAEVPYRQLAGAIEVELKKHMADKTNWQRMLKNDVMQGVDLIERKKSATDLLPEELKKYVATENKITELNYPVLKYPEKVSSMNFEKFPEIKGTLLGIKAQYLLFDGGRVINIRNQSGYVVKLKMD